MTKDDFFGQPVNVGDQVAFMLGCGPRNRREMTQGTVTKVLPSGINVRYNRWRSRDWSETLIKLDFIRVPDAYKNPRLELPT